MEADSGSRIRTSYSLGLFAMRRLGFALPPDCLAPQSCGVEVWRLSS